MKLQSSYELFDTYTWIFIALFIAGATILTFFLITYHPSTYSYCYINSQFQCNNASVYVNSSGSVLIIIVKNEVGTKVGFPSNAISVFPTYNNVSYNGSCSPSAVTEKNSFTCTVYMNNYFPSVGSQINSRYNIFYGICSNCSVHNLNSYQVSGTLTVDVLSRKNFS